MKPQRFWAVVDKDGHIVSSRLDPRDLLIGKSRSDFHIPDPERRSGTRVVRVEVRVITPKPKRKAAKARAKAGRK